MPFRRKESLEQQQPSTVTLIYGTCSSKGKLEKRRRKRDRYMDKKKGACTKDQRAVGGAIKTFEAEFLRAYKRYRERREEN